MIFKRLRAKNFLSLEQISLNLENQGLVLITGENLDNPFLSSNGAGKSSIIEAIVYTLYGRTLRGLKGDDVVSKTAEKDCVTSLTLQDDEHEYEVVRCRKESKWKNSVFIFRDGVNITPPSDSECVGFISNLLSADYTTFTSSLLYSGESFKFTSATDSEMKKTFDMMLGLDVYSKARERAKESLTECSSAIRTNQSLIISKKSSLDTLKSQLKVMEQSRNNYIVTKTNKVRDLESKISVTKANIKLKSYQLSQVEANSGIIKEKLESTKNLIASIKDSLKEIEALKQKNIEITSKLKEIELNMTLYQSQSQKLAEELATYTKKSDDVSSKINILKKKLLSLNDKVGKPCPVCGRPLKQEHIEPARDEIQQTIQFLKGELDSISQSVGDINSSLQEYQDKIADSLKSKYFLKKTIFDNKEIIKSHTNDYDNLDVLEHDIEDYIKKSSDADVQIITLKQDKSHLIETLDELNARLEKLNSEKNPYDDTISQALLNTTQTQKELKELNTSLEGLTEKQSVIEFWVNAYGNGGIKSFVLDSITPYLNRQANFYLSKLTGGNIEAVFSTQSTLKSGEHREKFSISILNKNGGNTYTSNSSGERKRIDLAINLALQDLVASRGNSPISLAIYDEVFDALDEKGIEAVVDILIELANKKSSIFVVSHNDYLQSYFTKSIKVVKQKGRSKIF